MLYEGSGCHQVAGDTACQDFVEARHWFAKAADQGVAEAQKYLGFMTYEGTAGPLSIHQHTTVKSFALEGEGGEKDVVAARKWFEAAALQGHANEYNPKHDTSPDPNWN